MFEIRLNGEFLENRRTWNSSVRAIERHAREKARENGVYLYLTGSEAIRDKDGFDFDYGYRIWSGGGLEFKFTIERVK